MSDQTALPVYPTRPASIHLQIPSADLAQIRGLIDAGVYTRIPDAIRAMIKMGLRMEGGRHG